MSFRIACCDANWCCWDQIYWRGRIWAPQEQRYAGLVNYADIPAVKAKKVQGLRTMPPVLLGPAPPLHAPFAARHLVTVVIGMLIGACDPTL